MASRDPIPTTLREQLRQLGLGQTAADLDDSHRPRDPEAQESGRPTRNGSPGRTRGPRPPPGGTPAERRPPRPLPADGGLGLGLAETDPSAHGRTRLDARLRDPARERDFCRGARTGENDAREKSSPRGRPGRPLGALCGPRPISSSISPPKKRPGPSNAASARTPARPSSPLTKSGISPPTPTPLTCSFKSSVAAMSRNRSW